MTTPAPSEAAQKLTAFMNRMDNLLDTLDAAKEDVKNLKDEIKSDGFNVRAFTKAVKMRRDERAREREAEDHADLELYMAAVGQPLE